MLQNVMISSTARDLPEHREQVRLGCERIGISAEQMMENLSARDADAVDVSLKMVERAEVYICILAWRYGFEPPGADKSITEMEYDHAVRLGKPRLVFVIHDDHKVTRSDIETGPGEAKLQSLKDRIGLERVAAFFTSPNDLRGHVVEALTNLGKDMSQEDAVATAARKLNRTLVIPQPPEPFIAHPYTLLQSRDLVGRQAELRVLTDWVAEPGAPVHQARILNLVAIGGMGKSALAWHWLNRIAPHEMAPLDGRMWWSFYESDSGFESFMNRALVYTGGATGDEVRDLTWPEKETRLLAVFDQNPFLLVLDGFERALLAYHRMDAAHLADEHVDAKTANHVANVHGLPKSAGQSFVGQHRLRQTTDPRVGQFLARLTQARASRILITTRLYPSALQLPNGAPKPGCDALFLPGLSEDDAMALWRELGVSGARSELRPIFRSVENHPLLLQALASEVATYRLAPGDFARWRADHPDFDPTSLPLEQSRTHILYHALKGLDPGLRQTLETIVAFRMPASYDTLEALLVGDTRPCADAAALDRTLGELEDRGLIGWDRAANRYDAHPIVRGVVWNLTGKEDQRAVLSALEAHFEPMETPDSDEVDSLADLGPAIERYNTLVGLGRFDTAYELFSHRLDGATLYRLAAHRERIEWLERLFPDGTDQLPAIGTQRGRSWVLNALALSYQFSGNLKIAAALFRRCAKIDEDADDVVNLGTDLQNLGICLVSVGELRGAAQAQGEALALSREQNNTFAAAICHRELGDSLRCRGQVKESNRHLKRAGHLSEQHGASQSLGVVCACRSESALNTRNLEEAKKLSDESWERGLAARNERDVIRAALLQGQTAFALGNDPKANERLHFALTRSRAANLVEFELPSLVALSRRALKIDGPSAARKLLEEVWEPAERGPYPLIQADAFNLLADIARTEGDRPGAVDAATRAYELAWCDGPPWAYHWGLEAAREHLAALDAPEPALPPFDETKFDPLPDISIPDN